MELAALSLSVLALLLAILAVVKVRLLEFCPEVLAGDVIVPRGGRAATAARLLLPLQFTNAGNAGGLVQWVALRVTIDGQADRPLLLSPVAEIDMQRFIQAKRRLTEDNTIEPFTAFALEGKRAVAKFVLFDVAERPRAAPLVLRPGRYRFELFVKATHAAKPRLERTFEHVLEPKHLEDYRDDLAVYLIDYHISLPGVRRALADQEWLPRASAA
ncbi:MAG TPA: hypothetical protein VM489_05480 [Burkholderiales bacterium]|nr:hypothetical protein [Burkholderiales bacterium]